MKLKKTLTAICSFIICLSFPIVATASAPTTTLPDDTSVISSEDPSVTTTEQETTVNDNVTETSDETETTYPLDDDVEEPTTVLEEYTEIIEEPTTQVQTTETKENRVTIYFKDIEITTTAKIKNVKTGEVIEFDINSSNGWTYSGVIEPGTYEIVSIKPECSQYKVKIIRDNDGNKIKEFKVEKTEGIQVINLYPETKVIFGIFSFLSTHIFLDVCAILLIALYIINAKGYRIPILSSWIDNYRK